MVKRRTATGEQKAKPERKQASKTSSEVKHYEIHRLLEYPQVKVTNSTAKVEFIGEFAPGANFEDEIDQRCGEGWYRVTERQVSGKLGHSWIVRGRDVLEEYSEQTFEENGQPIERERVIIKNGRSDLLNPVVFQSMIEATARKAVEVMRAENPARAGASFDDTLAQIERLEELKERLSPKPQQAQSEPVANEKSLEDRLFETALVKLIETGDESTIEKVLDVLRPTKEPSFLDSLAEIIKPLVPSIVEAGRNIWLSRQPAIQPAAISSEASANRTTEQAAPMTQTQEPGQQPGALAQQVFNRVIQRMIEDCLDDVDVGASADRIAAFGDQFPEYQALVDQLKKDTPSNVLIQLAQIAPGIDWTRAVHAEGWISELQEALNSTSDESDHGDETDATEEDAALASAKGKP